MSRSVLAISPDAPLAQALRLMVDNRISGLPVVDPEGRPLGMLTEGDLLRRVETGTGSDTPGWVPSLFLPGHLAGQYVRTHGRRVSEVMTPNVVSIEEGVSLSKAVALMRRKRIKRLPVVREGIVVGIVSRADLVRVICKTLEAPAAIADDTTIEENILEELGRQRWLPRNSVGVAVENGVVLIDGCVSDIRERNAIGVLAATVPGVKRVENRLICVEANTGVLIYDPDDEVLQ